MAATREERLQERLRGGQKRQVKDVDFGFSFPAAPEAPPQTEPSIQRTPQPELNQQLTARATPASRGRGRPSKAALAEQALNKGPAHTVSNANMSAKRRKLDSDEAPSSSRSTRSSLRAPRADIYALPGDEESLAFAADTVADTISETVERDAEAVPINSASQALSTPRSKIAQASALPTATEEVAESPAENPGSGHRLRIGLNAATAQSSQLQNALQFASPTTAASAAIQTPSQRNKRKRGSATPSGAILSAKRGRQSPRDEESLVVDDLDAPSTVQSRSSTRKSPRLHDSNNEVSSVASTSRDRSSIGAQEIEGRSSLKPTLRSGTSNQHYITNVSQEANISDYSIDLAEEISDHEAAVILKKSRGRRVSRNLPTLESPDLDENTEATPPVRRDGGAKSRKVSTPAQQRHPKPAVSKANRKASSGTVKKPSKSSRARAKNPIHITVHRLNNKPIYEGNERDVDIINLDVPNAKRAGVNAIDVLSHLCQEIINSGLSTLEVGREESQEPSLKREYTTKWRALEAFKSALQTQLLEHTVNLDNTLSLERRVRDERKKKLALREDILRVRGEREKVALCMDEIRIKHEKESILVREREFLNNNIHEIELAVERGRANQFQPADGPRAMVGTEVLLKRVAGLVSKKSDNGGMLQQVQDFNAFLERAALALEGRKV